MLICYADNMLSDEEFLVLWQILACNIINNNNNVFSVFPRLIVHGTTYYSNSNEKSELKTHN